MAAAAASSGSSSNAPALSEYEKALKQNKEIEEKYPNIHLGEPASLLAVYSSNKEIIAKQSQGSAVAGTPPHRTMSGACLSLCSLSWSYACLWSCAVGCRCGIFILEDSLQAQCEHRQPTPDPFVGDSGDRVEKGLQL